jgi:hypothetical protein
MIAKPFVIAKVFGVMARKELQDHALNSFDYHAFDAKITGSDFVMAICYDPRYACDAWC